MPQKHAHIPENTRVYAIGDVHGRLDLLERLLNTIAQDSKTAPNRRVLVMLGDLVDRGPDSFGVLNALTELHTQPPFDTFEIHFIKGNHEQLMQDFMSGSEPDIWFNCGGMATLTSYNVPYLSDDEDVSVMRDSLNQAMPASHHRLLESMKSIHREGGYAFVHAGVRPGVSLQNQDPDDLMWIRASFLDAQHDFGAMIVHGHSPVIVPDVLSNRIAIDTRAWCSGTLTAVSLEGTEQRFLST
ncbi:MAG: serine/threonine protein phosphatase [Magnetovibrio sp.]|nr:serine/threonine protein phosphatase [Magnetovibrio sp.]